MDWRELSPNHKLIRDFKRHLVWLIKSHIRQFRGDAASKLGGKNLTNFGGALLIIASGIKQNDLWLDEVIIAYDGARTRGISANSLKDILRKSLDEYKIAFDAELKNFPSWDFENELIKRFRNDMWDSLREDLEGRIVDFSRASPPPFTQRHPALWAVGLILSGAIITEVVKWVAHTIG